MTEIADTVEEDDHREVDRIEDSTTARRPRGKAYAFALFGVLLACVMSVENARLRERLDSYFGGFHPVDATYVHAFAQTWIEPVTWDPEAPLTEELPLRVRALHGKRISISGYMRPVEWDAESDEDLLKSFILTPHPPGCCLILPLHEQILVEMPEGRLASCATETLNRVRGTFVLRPDIGEDGRVWLLFRMQAHEVLDTGRHGFWPR